MSTLSPEMDPVNALSLTGRLQPETFGAAYNRAAGCLRGVRKAEIWGCVIAEPVWVLSVDLQTKTATFQSGMADAAKSARSAFTEIKSGSSEMGSSIGGNMFAARHSIMAVSEAFGVQVPRAITALLAHIGPLGAALEAAFPFAAIALGAVLLIEKLAEMKAAGVKLTEDQVRFGTAVQTAFNALEQKLLSSQIKADELRNDHLGALRHELQLINMQSMEELVKSVLDGRQGSRCRLRGLEEPLVTPSAPARPALSTPSMTSKPNTASLLRARQRATKPRTS